MGDGWGLRYGEGGRENDVREHDVSRSTFAYLKCPRRQGGEPCLGGDLSGKMGRRGSGGEPEALPILTAPCLLPSVNRTLIAHTKTLDPSRPVTFVTNTNYEADLGVSLGVSAHLPSACPLVLP